MKTPRFSLTAVLLCACLLEAGPTVGQTRPTGGQSGVSSTFAYNRKKVVFDAAGKKKPVEGTLTLPRRSEACPAILFVTGAWSDNRDDTGEAERLRALADYLGEHGIAVLQLRRPLGGRSTSDLSSASSATFETDIRAGLAYLKQRPDIDSQQIGLFGQNENGAIATVTATLTRDVSFLILAGTAVLENDLSSRPSGPVNIYDLRPLLERVPCPVLVLQGDQDTSFPLRETRTAYRAALLAGNNHNTTYVTLPGLNRALETTTGQGRSESDIAPVAMRTLTRWVNVHTSGQGSPESEAPLGDAEEVIPHRKQSNPFGDAPGGLIGQFRYRREMLWIPAIGGQPRPYGDWYW